MQNKITIGILLAPVLILLIPFVAMQFTDEVNWTRSDFMFMGILLYGASLGYVLMARVSGNVAYRAAAGVACAAGLLLVWVNAAVGIIGDPEDGSAMIPNLMYFGMLAVGFIGAVIARFQPLGMSRALFTMAIAQMLVPVIALVIAKPQITMEPPGVVGVFGLNAFFAMLWAVSALLFRLASATAQGSATTATKVDES